MLKKHYDFSTPMFHLYETGTYYFSKCVYTWHQNLMCIHVDKADTHMASNPCACIKLHMSMIWGESYLSHCHPGYEMELQQLSFYLSVYIVGYLGILQIVHYIKLNS